MVNAEIPEDMDGISAELRNPAFGKKIASAIRSLAEQIDRHVKIMHVCGTHEHIIAEFGLRSLLPSNVEIVSGPGCPVCVCPTEDIDLAIAIAEQPDTILATFGDMLRVPATRSSLAEARARGADIRVVFGPAEAIKLAGEMPDKEVVFFSIGFETTAPLVAYELIKGVPPNFSVICAHKTIPPAMELIVSMPDVEIDGFITPGHVSTIIGTNPFKLFSEAYRYPCIVTGFEPNDILMAVYLTLKQIYEGRSETINEYSRAVRPEGNKKALEVINRVYREATSKWRGIGRIPGGGYELSDEFTEFDAARRFEIDIPESIDIPPGCSCHLILTGKIKPHQCPLFGKRCTPYNPIGPCMVSYEGTCKIAYQFGDVSPSGE